MILGQNPSSQLLQEIERVNLETLSSIGSPQLPQRSRFLKALKSLSCSVVLSDVENEYTAVANVILPRSTSWEESDILLHRGLQFAVKSLPTSGALHPQFADSKSAYAILNTLGNNIV